MFTLLGNFATCAAAGCTKETTHSGHCVIKWKCHNTLPLPSPDQNCGTGEPSVIELVPCFILDSFAVNKKKYHNEWAKESGLKGRIKPGEWAIQRQILQVWNTCTWCIDLIQHAGDGPERKAAPFLSMDNFARLMQLHYMFTAMHICSLSRLSPNVPSHADQTNLEHILYVHHCYGVLSRGWLHTVAYIRPLCVGLFHRLQFAGRLPFVEILNTVTWWICPDWHSPCHAVPLYPYAFFTLCKAVRLSPSLLSTARVLVFFTVA